uniref:Uncharacterized protein n=1 Tax=Romanomermis culicivorax TaxID=13658 RepID=A0A915IYT8_ROMCU
MNLKIGYDDCLSFPSSVNGGVFSTDNLLHPLVINIFSFPVLMPIHLSNAHGKPMPKHQVPPDNRYEYIHYFRLILLYFYFLGCRTNSNLSQRYTTFYENENETSSFQVTKANLLQKRGIS